MAPSSETTNTKLAVIQRDIHYILGEVEEIKRMQQSNFVTKDEFDFYKRMTWVLIGIVAAGIGTLFFNLLSDK